MATKILSNFQKYCNDKTIAVVGNSSCIFNNTHGKLIDSHDIVIRFNWTIDTLLKKWPANVGTKFNVYVYSIKSPGKLKQILNKGILKDKNFIIRTRHDDSNYFDLDIEYRKKILYYSQDEFRESISNDFFINKEPSAGAMAIQFLLDCIDFKSISLFGFDFFESSGDMPRQSNEFKSFFYSAHDKGYERQFFEHLISEYKGTNKFNFYK